MDDERTTAAINYYDLMTWIDSEETYLKKFYPLPKISKKKKMLFEYYKYHNDIPRLFMLPTTDILNQYHDDMR